MNTETLRPGSVHVFGGRKSLVLGVGVFAKRQGKNIHIHITGTSNRHTTVTNAPDSRRYHRTLFRDLRRLLITNDLWAFGDEGEETEKAQAE